MRAVVFSLSLWKREQTVCGVVFSLSLWKRGQIVRGVVFSLSLQKREQTVRSVVCTLSLWERAGVRASGRTMPVVSRHPTMQTAQANKSRAICPAASQLNTSIFLNG